MSNESMPLRSKPAAEGERAGVRKPRRLLAVLAAQIAVHGHDGPDARAVVDRLRRDVIRPTLAENRGKLVRWTGGAFLAVFESAYDAAHGALVLRNLLQSGGRETPRRERPTCRLGIGLGEVVVEADSIHGDAVTVAERLAGLAGPGDIYVSGGMYEQIANRLVCKHRPLGEVPLQGIAHPVRAYAVSPMPVIRATRFRLSRPADRAAAAAAALFGCALGLGALYAPQRVSLLAVAAPAAEAARVRPWIDPAPPKAGPKRPVRERERTAQATKATR